MSKAVSVIIKEELSLKQGFRKCQSIPIPTFKDQGIQQLLGGLVAIKEACVKTVGQHIHNLTAIHTLSFHAQNVINTLCSQRHLVII